MKKQFLLFILSMLIGLFSATYAQKVGPSTIKQAVYHDVIGPIKDLPTDLIPRERHERDGGLKERYYPFSETALPIGNDPVWQKENGNEGTNKAPDLIFDGQNSPYYPSDCNGQAGPNHFMQAVNCSYAIYNKAGTLLAGPTDFNTLFAGVTGAGYNDGDPIILYDGQADRWLAAEFSISGSNDYMLIAVSQTGDPTGIWDRWSFDVDDMPDYMKFGVWRDGYYMSTNTYGGDDVYVFDRDEMLAGGASPTMIGFENNYRPNSGFHCIMPLDNDGDFAPNGTPGQFITINDDAWGGGGDALWIFELEADWATPGNSTFARTQTISTAAFDSEFNAWGVGDIDQPGTSQLLDGIPMILMYRAQYRNWGTSQSIVCCHTVDVDATNHAGVRWYELENTGSDWSVRQQGTYAPDAHSRWMASIAMNSNHEIALGYSISSTSEYPGIRYCGQSSSANSSATGLMDIAEDIIYTGSNYQSSYTRWGDYSQMSIDPTDDVTFWYTDEYINSGKKTKIASFEFIDTGDPALTATAASTSQIDLSWTKNDDGDDVMLVWSVDGTFGTPVDGTSYSASDVISGGGQVLYVGSGISYNHTGLNEGQTYYYKAWSIMTGTVYSSGNSANATTNSSGSMTVIFDDDFDTDKGWTLNGEWERTAPQGLGGTSYGNPDPSSAFVGTNVLGLDLTSDGDYESNINDAATSPAIDCSLYTDVHVYFRLWINVEGDNWDHTVFNVSGNNGSSWDQVFTNGSTGYTLDSWYITSHDDPGFLGWNISNYADGNSEVLLQYVLDSDSNTEYSGWNVDSVQVTGIPVPCSAPSIIAHPQSQTVCESDNVTFTVVADGTGLTYQWKKGGSNISGETSTSYTISGVVSGDAGDYTCEVIGTCGSVTSNIAVLTVNPLPSQPSAITGETAPCEGDNETYSVTNVPGVTYAWDLPAGWTGSSTTNSITVTVGATSGNVTVTPSNSCGAGTSRSLAVTVESIPSQPSAISGETAPCEAASETYNVTNVSGVTYAWDLPSGWTGSSTTNSIDVTVGSSGGTISVTPSNDCGTGTARTLDVTIGIVTAITDQPDDVNATEGDNVSFSVVAAGENLSYQWRFNSSNISGADADTYSINNVQQTDAGNYDVIVSGDCGNETSDVAILSVSVSVQDLAEYGISIYPNPSNGSFNIVFENSVKEAFYRIRDMTGKVIHEEKLIESENIINLNSIPKGMYFIELNFDNQSVVSKIVIE